MIGMGAMIHYLGGGSENDAASYCGRKITAAQMKDNRLNLTFADGIKIAIWDDGQSCCENRYMTTDDDVSSLVGHLLHHIEGKEASNGETDYGECYESVFVEIGTDDGCVTIVNHVEHNGYYGGFGLTITEETS